MIAKSLIGQTFTFDATLENWAEGMDYCAVAVPHNITQALGTKGPVLVMASVNGGAPFQVSLFPVGGGKHYIRIKAKVRKLSNTQTGELINLSFVILNPDDVDIPDDLLSVLEAEAIF